jgi:hypothetical protein
MDHMEATSTGAAERYVLGEMGDRERDQYEEHYFDCPDCAEDVKAAAIFVENAEPVLGKDARGPAPGDQRKRAGQGDDPSKPWTRLRDLFWPVPLGAAAALVVLLGLSAYQGLVVLTQLTRELGAAGALQSAPSYFLSVSRGEAPVVRASAGQRVVALTLSRSSEGTFPFYRCELKDADGRTLLSALLPGPAQGDELQILLPAQGLRPGAHVLVVTGLESPSASAPPSPSAQYHFVFARGGEAEPSR